MAEILIQQKKSRAWLWVLAVLVLASLIWGALALFRSDHVEVVPATSAVPATPATPAIDLAPTLATQGAAA